MARKTDIDLEGRLALHAWTNDLFGCESTREILSDLERADEGFDGEGHSGIFHRLSSQSDIRNGRCRPGALGRYYPSGQSKCAIFRAFLAARAFVSDT